MNPTTIGRPCERPASEHNRLRALGLTPALVAALAAPAAQARRRVSRAPR